LSISAITGLFELARAAPDNAGFDVQRSSLSPVFLLRLLRRPPVEWKPETLVPGPYVVPLGNRTLCAEKTHVNETFHTI
jgi:hypothetical protein